MENHVFLTYGNSNSREQLTTVNSNSATVSSATNTVATVCSGNGYSTGKSLEKITEDISITSIAIISPMYILKKNQFFNHPISISYKLIYFL